MESSKNQEFSSLRLCTQQVLFALESNQYIILVNEISVSHSQDLPQALSRTGRQVFQCVPVQSVLQQQTQGGPKEMSHVGMLSLLRSSPPSSGVVLLQAGYKRTVLVDLLILRLKALCAEQKRLQVVISEWPGPEQQLQKYFGEALSIQTSLPPYIKDTKCQIFYQKHRANNYITQALKVSILLAEEGEDVLVYVANREEIELFVQIGKQVGPKGVEFVGFYGQYDAQKSNGGVRVVVGTGKSIMYRGLKHINRVVDTMFENKRVKSQFGQKYEVKPISKDVANRRARMGYCYRICTQKTFQDLRDYDSPEIESDDIDSLLLRLMLNNQSPLCQDLITPVPQYQLAHSLTRLSAFQLISVQGSLTPLGTKVAILISCLDFSLSPQLAHLLINSCQAEFECCKQAVQMVSMLLANPYRLDGSALGVLKAKKRLGVKEGDHLSLVNVMAAYQQSNNHKAFCKQHYLNVEHMAEADYYSQSLQKALRYLHLDPKTDSAADPEAILRCVVGSLFMQVAQLQPDGQYSVLQNRAQPCSSLCLNLHPQSILTHSPPRLIVFSEIVYSGPLKEYFLHNATAIETVWLNELASHYFLDRTKEIITQNRLKDIKARTQAEEDQALMESLAQKKANVKSDFQLGTYRSIHSLGYKQKDKPEEKGKTKEQGEKQKAIKSRIQLDYEF